MKLRDWRTRLAAAAAGVAAALLLVELVLRFGHPWLPRDLKVVWIRSRLVSELHHPHPTLLWAPSPNLTLSYPSPRMPWRLKHVPYPDDPTTGYRADAPAKVPVDLAVIGDSYTYGFEVDQDRTWVEVLKRTTGLNAVNLAVTSYGTSQEADLFRLYGKSFKPKAVLQVIATNDPLDDVYYNEFNAKKDPRLSNLCWHMGLPQPSFVCDAATRLMKSSILGCLAVFQIQARVKRNYNKEGMTRGTEMICADAKAVKEEARRGGAKYAAALIGFWGNPGVAPYRARLDACLAREGIPVLFLDELAESRRRGRPFFGRFDLHWNDEGHAFVASRVKEFLEGLGWFKGLRRPA